VHAGLNRAAEVQFNREISRLNTLSGERNLPDTGKCLIQQDIKTPSRRNFVVLRTKD
jgi:hypothetical protein